MLSDKYWDVIIKDSKCLSLRPLKNYDQIAKSCLPNNIRVASEYAFVIINGEFWMIDLEKAKSNMKSLLREVDNNSDSDDFIENWYEYHGNYFKSKKETYDHLIILLHKNPYMKCINKFIELSTSNDKSDQHDEDDKHEFTIEWHYEVSNDINDNCNKKVEIKVFKKNNGNSICKRTDYVVQMLEQSQDEDISSEIISDNNLILLTDMGLFVYYFNENSKSISLIYFYYMHPFNIELFLKPTLPLPNYDSFKHCDEWISSIKDHKESLLKYGTELLKFAIKEHNSGLINDIYKKCINYFKEDLGNNKMFLSIITTTMPLLNKYYPEYITRYSLATTMIVDSPFYVIEDKHINLHLYSFQHCLQMTDITQSIWWLDYRELMRNYETKNPFVETINRNIYKTWNGEVLIKFKLDNYGKYYYTIIWIGFIAFLGCFTAAATIPDIDDDVRNKLLTSSIVLGFIHLSFEGNIINHIINIIDVIAYVLPIYISIIWLQTKEMNIIPLLSFSCLFLDIKFLLFLRAFEYFGVYFAIIISVAKQIVSFLVVLFIIIISFAHAFYILLLPRSPFSLDERTNNNDPNNPWNIVPSYNLVFENGTVDTNPYIIQLPNGNTNMFINFKTSLFAMYKFLTGDSDALSNWTYVDDALLAIMIVLFSLLIVVYLMNLLIGLLNNAIEKDNNRVSFLIQKAEILAEIELFYLLPYQRRKENWFPEVMYYYANNDKTRKKIKEMMDNKEWDTNEFAELKQYLLKGLNVEYSTDE
ncbi:hypothetical protein RclHR1_01230019 [Rhizophagus clarus]|uniref:Ion transport domain-containing protein n=1 Tax=Rhizophagus clarus TaxID=94130 RepID=A0A2Z6QZT0_9GLOM|nr:hypothetical protein RclHR1_01230019 [Rhizophagus clarus]